jgi:myo-inositol-1(or 4)-monophosphatase
VENQMSEALQERMSAGLEITRQAGKLALSYYEQAKNGSLAITTKGTQDWLSEADQAVERLIRREFAAAFPQDGFWGEETGGSQGNQGVWVVDPIDGTSNFVRGIDLWCISVAYHQPGEASLGFIFDPVHERMYSAQKGGGAFCNGKPIKVSQRKAPDRSLVILGTSLRTPIEMHHAIFGYLHKHKFDYRRLGSAAIGLTEVASGRVEAYFERHLNSWDCLAGLLLVQEAGGACTPFESDEFIKNGGMVLGSNAALRLELERLMELAA